MTTNERDDAPRDVVAEARALLATYNQPGHTVAMKIVMHHSALHQLGILADECDALRAERDALRAERDALAQRVAGLEKRVDLLENDDDYVEVDPRWLRVFSGTATDDDYASIVAEYGADAAPEPPSRETGADGAWLSLIFRGLQFAA